MDLIQMLWMRESRSPHSLPLRFGMETKTTVCRNQPTSTFCKVELVYRTTCSACHGGIASHWKYQPSSGRRHRSPLSFS
ncbi:hypothetical protein B0O80DRAFT_466321 [Mortierella sp. GBAus27b]|nr:hypothetical protein B0O80DRAFT_466321 [Mortierella sp. GBAus27b]